MNDSAPLHRAISGRMVGGVAAGLATYLGVDVTIVRIGFVVATVLGGGIGIAAYLAGLLLIPEEGAGQSMASSLIDSARGGR
jgi:phage shock protein PspC (stress-responsive transcriptional regulator)